jgi:hypothetical protein
LVHFFPLWYIVQRKIWQPWFRFACQSDEEPENIVGALEDSKDPEVAQDFLQTGVLHVAHAAQNLGNENAK